MECETYMAECSTTACSYLYHRFRWIFCQLEFLRRCLPARIRQALGELPESLDGTYERILQDIDEANWKFSHRIFQCVSVTSRPLRVEELAEFLAFDFHIIQQYMDHVYVKAHVQFCLYICKSPHWPTE